MIRPDYERKRRVKILPTIGLLVVLALMIGGGVCFIKIVRKINDPVVQQELRSEAVEIGRSIRRFINDIAEDD